LKGKEPDPERSGRSFEEGIPAPIFFGQMEKGGAVWSPGAGTHRQKTGRARPRLKIFRMIARRSNIAMLSRRKIALAKPSCSKTDKTDFFGRKTMCGAFYSLFHSFENWKEGGRKDLPF
jgi:hypothetical protein